MKLAGHAGNFPHCANIIADAFPCLFNAQYHAGI